MSLGCDTFGEVSTRRTFIASYEFLTDISFLELVTAVTVTVLFSVQRPFKAFERC